MTTPNIILPWPQGCREIWENVIVRRRHSGFDDFIIFLWLIKISRLADTQTTFEIIAWTFCLFFRWHFSKQLYTRYNNGLNCAIETHALTYQSETFYIFCHYYLQLGSAELKHFSWYAIGSFIHPLFYAAWLTLTLTKNFVFFVQHPRHFSITCWYFQCNLFLFLCEQISSTLVEKFTSITPEDLQMSRTIMSVVKMAGGGQEAKHCDSCGNTAVKYLNLFHSLWSLKMNF